MKLSAPIHVLKSKAKTLKKSKLITMTTALDEVAKAEGYNSWSLLQAKCSTALPQTYDQILDYFNFGDLVLVGARPGMGKTSFTIGLFVQAIKQKRPKSFFFSLSEIHRNIETRMTNYDKSLVPNDDLFVCDYSDYICADYIIEKTNKDIQESTVIVIDYLQLLDQKRSTPEVQIQIERLKQYAKEKGCIIIFISQVDRAIESRIDKKPLLQDIKIINKLEINLFNKILFLHFDDQDNSNAEVLFRMPKDFNFKINRENNKAVFF